MKLKSIMKPRVPIIESGSYLAVCVGVLAIGEQYVDRSAFGGKSDYESQLVFVFEFPSELDNEGKPKQLSKDVNATNAPNGSLNKIMKDWNSREYTREQLAEFDFDEQLGKACQITVLVSESGYSKITGISAVPKGVPVPTSSTPHISFSVEAWDDEAFEALPEWAQERIKKSTQYQKEHAPTDKIGVQPAVQAPQTARRDPTQMVEQGHADSPMTAAPMGNPLGSFAAVPPSKGDFGGAATEGAQAVGGCPI